MEERQDLISRQAAIEEVRQAYENDEMLDGYEYRLLELPSVQPEPCEDAVSREAAIRCCTFGRTSLGLADELRRLPSVTPKEQRWIPCSERLPVDDDYRESMECLDGCVWYFTDEGSMGLGYYYYSTKEWSTLRDLKPDGKVIAWMPLPEPYREEGEK